MNTITVVRSGESIYAIIRWNGPAKDTDLLDAVQEAVTKWVNTTGTGREVWEGACEDLNIGDLSEYVDDVRPFLEEQGILDFSVELGGDEYVSNHWLYDTVLVNDLDLED